MNKLVLILGSVLMTYGFSEFTAEESVASSANPTADSLVYLEPKPEHASETFVIVNLLNRYHYRKIDLDDSLSSVVFDNYFESLDPNKSYFLKSDREYFEKYRYTLDEHFPEGNLDFGYQLFSVYRERSLARIENIYNLLEKEPDFNQDQYFETDRDKLPWAETHAELDSIWVKIIKNQAMSYKLAGKEWPDIADALKKRYQRVEKALYQYNSEDVYQAYMNALTSAYDPHTNYFSPIAKENFQIDMSLSLEGIGAQLTQQLDYTKVADIIPGGPAYKSKQLQKDDKIIGVAQGDDGEFVDVIGWRLDEVVQKIRGPKGSIVRLQIIKHNKDINSLPDTLRLVRDKIKLEKSAAKGEIIPITEGNQQYQLGVITVPSFYLNFEDMNKGVKDYRSTTRDVRKLIDSLNVKGMDGLVIDLRYNGGGSLQEAIELTGLFIPDGPVVQVRNTDNSVEVMKDTDGGKVFYDGPLAVLTNRYSASASEIFSGAIQDYKRGVVLGENTFGKGTVQNLIDIGRYMQQKDVDLGQLKMTLAKFYRVSGSSTQLMGVSPDIAFPSPYEDENFGESGRPTALPWDEIRTTKYDPTNTISDQMIVHLRKLYNKHLQTDEDLADLQKDVERVRKLREETKVSLNLEERKAQEQQESETEADLSTTLQPSEVFTDEVNSEKLSEDPYLKEALRLLAELSKNKIG
ncbi:carboxy terminal-processing peptidase [Marinoscillum furvescens]|uniref:Carboxyl-terminal processing protease n=1 Tax=Marinoscillum furvescens DSM 4134 TaxID=1122208 RepID=A0A3D9L2N9_MARFU|nr:carboxy terminal-processing peptidase [Marinoscillum furvescens]RED97959.1 carboxyl-terminal processing protease [Marinoscillum furvescens DSM 4134]